MMDRYDWVWRGLVGSAVLWVIVLVAYGVWRVAVWLMG